MVGTKAMCSSLAGGRKGIPGRWRSVVPQHLLMVTEPWEHGLSSPAHSARDRWTQVGNRRVEGGMPCESRKLETRNCADARVNEGKRTRKDVGKVETKEGGKVKTRESENEGGREGGRVERWKVERWERRRGWVVSVDLEVEERVSIRAANSGAKSRYAIWDVGECGIISSLFQHVCSHRLHLLAAKPSAL